jgi:xylulokinase
MDVLLGLDLGTTALKLGAYDTSGRQLTVATVEYDLITPQADYVEGDPETYWEAFRASLAALNRQHPINPEDSCALAISAQGETLFFVDEQGDAIRNAIVWMDNRATAEAAELAEEFGNEQCYAVTGQVSFEACWPASKVLWVRKHEPETFARTRTFALIEDYFIHRLTGVWAAEGSLLCSTTYWNITTKQYWNEMLEFLGVTPDQLPPIRESGEVVATILPEVANDLGLGANVAICTGCLDQVAGAIGIGNIREGIISQNIGAALAIVCPVSSPVFDPARRMPLHYFAEPGTYMIHTFTNGGMTLRWFRDRFGQIESAAERLTGIDAYELFDAEAESVPAGSDGLVMLPHLAGSMAPDVNAKARGVWFGTTLSHTKAHFTRSIMESIGYLCKRNLEALADMGIRPAQLRASGGGSKSRVWNQIIADVLGIELITTRSQDAATLGAAILAGKATGVFGSLESALDNVAAGETRYSPNSANRRVYDHAYFMYHQVFTALSPCFELISPASERDEAC